MARHAEGWKLAQSHPTAPHRVRFTHGGARIDRSTGTSDEGEASKIAAQIYAEVISGRRVGVIGATQNLVDDAAKFCTDYGLAHDPKTTENMEGYLGVQIIPFFKSLDRFTIANYNDFIRARLQKITRSTVRKEISAIRQFREWCIEHGIQGLEPVPSIPKKGHAGTRAKNARKRKATILSPEEIARLLVAMPERSKRTGAFVRPFFTVLWETGLRPYSTVMQLEAPLHYERGQADLFVAREIDKNKYERRVPLTAAAREALDRVCPEHGKLFDMESEKNMRDSLRAAMGHAGITKPFSIYDFRHSRISYLANSGAPLPGVALLAGHLHVSTTALYVQANTEAAVEALAIAEQATERRRGRRRA